MITIEQPDGPGVVFVLRLPLELRVAGGAQLTGTTRSAQPPALPSAMLASSSASTMTVMTA